MIDSGSRCQARKVRRGQRLLFYCFLCFAAGGCLLSLEGESPAVLRPRCMMRLAFGAAVLIQAICGLKAILWKCSADLYKIPINHYDRRNRI